MLSIGAIQSALDWFLAIDMWEECVACYNTQGHRHKVFFNVMLPSPTFQLYSLKNYNYNFYRLQKFLKMS